MKFAHMGNCMKKDTKLDKEIIIAIFGLDDAGKTTIVKVLKGDKDFKETVPTLGFTPVEFKYNNQHAVRIVDLAGKATSRELWKHYLAESYGYIFVIDSSNKKRIEESRKEFVKFIENEKVSDKPILVLVNKQDKPGAIDESEILHTFNIEDLVNKNKTPCRVETTSAILLDKGKMDPSLKAGFDWLVKHIIHNYATIHERVEGDVKQQRQREAKERKEISDRVNKKREQERRYNEEDDTTEYTQIKHDPFKPIGDRFKESKFTSNSTLNSESRTSSLYDNKNDYRSASPKSRLSPINEEKNNFNKGKFMKNKLAPLNDSDLDTYNRGGSKTNSWAITNNTSMTKRNGLAPI